MARTKPQDYLVPLLRRRVLMVRRRQRGGGAVAEVVDPVFASDAFGASDGTALEGRTADVGGTWTRGPAANAVRDFEIRDGRIRMTSFTTAQQANFQLDGGAMSLSQEITVTTRCLGALNNNTLGVIGYASAAADTFYGLRYANASTRWELFKLVAGTTTTIGTYTQSLAADTDYEMTLRLELGSQEVLIDGVSRITATDTAIRAPGRVGVRGTGTTSETTSTGWRLDHFEARQGLQTVDLFWSVTDGGANSGLQATYNTARIPAITITAGGTIVVIAEVRTTDEADTRPMDLACWRGTDWTALTGAVIAPGDGRVASAGWLNINPVLLPDSSSGRLYLVFMRYPGTSSTPTYTQLSCRFGTNVNETATLWVTYSDDDGATWSAPANVTTTFKPSNWSSMWSGPGNAVVKQHAPHAGRLVLGLRGVIDLELSLDHTLTNVYALFSDDDGATWEIGGEIPPIDGTSAGAVTESHIAETSDGMLVMFNRVNAAGNWHYTTSDDGGETWETLTSVSAIDQPNVNCGFAILPNGTWIVTHPDNDANTNRINMTVRYSLDSGVTWNTKTLPAGNYPVGTRVESCGAAYSAITYRSSDQSLLVVYERGVGGTYPAPYDRLSLVRVPLSWLGIE